MLRAIYSKGSLFSLNLKNRCTRSRILTYVRVYVLPVMNIVLLGHGPSRLLDGTDGRGWGVGGLGDGLPMVSRVSLWGLFLK